jgi:8-oxo-dGTP diphosphatase
MRQSVSIFPVRANGGILLQLRDDRPDLVNANLWATLGGSVEPGETPEWAAFRELAEEVGSRPAALLAAGFVDAPSPSDPGEVLRVLLFGAAVDWSLADLILAEGQCVQWFRPETARALPIAPPIDRALAAFLASDVSTRVRAAAPAGTEAGIISLASGLLPRLGLHSGQLLALHGANAAFVRHLWETRRGVRITTSPPVHERPDAILCWPRGERLEPLLTCLDERLQPGGALWIVLATGGEARTKVLAELRCQAEKRGLCVDAEIGVTAAERAVRWGGVGRK